MTHTLAATVVQFFSYKSKRAIKNRGTEFSFSSVPTVGVSLQLLATHHGVGGDPAKSWATEGSQQDYLHFWVQTRTSDDPTAHQYSPQLLPLEYPAPSPARYPQSRSRRHSGPRAGPRPCSHLGSLDSRREAVESHLEACADQLLASGSSHCAARPRWGAAP